MSLFSHTCILRRRGEQTGTDRYGRPEYGPPTDVECPAWWEMSAESEDTDARNQYVSTYTLYLPLSGPIEGWDAVVLGTDPDGTEYEAVGRPGRQPGGFIVEGYYRVQLERVTG